MRWQARKSGRVKDAQPEQVETGAAIHLPLDQLQTVDLPFDHPVAPGQPQRCGDSILVPPEVARKGCIRELSAASSQIGHAAAFRLRMISNRPLATCASEAISGEAR